MADLQILIEWWVVPCVLAALLIYVVFFIPDENADAVILASSRSGKWSGLLLLALFIVGRKSSQDAYITQTPPYSFDFLSTTLSTGLGFCLLLGFNKLKVTRFVGIFAFFMVAALSITLYSYFFIATIRSSVIFWSLGFALGMMLNKMIFPEIEAKDQENPEKINES